MVAESFMISYSSIGKVTPAWEMGNFFIILLYALEENKENRDWFATAKEKNNEITRSMEDYTGPRPCSS